MKKLVLIAALGLTATLAQAEVAVVVNPANSATLDKGSIKKIFLGKSKSFPDGATAKPVNQDGTAASKEFNSKVVGKSGSQLNAYWSKLVFTGKGTPPEKLASDQAVLDFVAANAGAIGYVDASKVSGNVKVAAKF